MNTDTVYNEEVTELPVRFRCHGFEYNDPILIHEFNAHSAIFNIEIKRLLRYGENPSLIKIPRELLSQLNYRGYPIINPKTLELEWWLHEKDLKYVR